MDRFNLWLADTLTQRARWVWVCLFAVLIFAGVGYRWSREPFRSFLAERRDVDVEQEITVLEEVKDQFGIRRNDAFLVIQGEDLLSRDSIRAIRRLVADLEALPQVEQVFSIDDIPILNVFGLADPLLPPDSGSVASFRAARERVVAHPLIAGQLLSEDGRTMMLPIRVNWLEVVSDQDVNERLLQVAEESLQSAEQDLTLGLTGDVPLFLSQMEAYRRNQRKFQIIGYVLVVVFAAILFRSVMPIVIVGAAPMLAIFITFGLMRWVGVHANPMTDAVLPVLLALMGVTDGVHLMQTMRVHRAGGESSDGAVRSAMTDVGSACVMTSLTTAVGFGSLSFAHSEFVRDFGQACAVGVLITLACVLTVIPLLSNGWLGRRLHQGLSKDLILSNIGRIGGGIDWILRYRRIVSLSGIAITLCFGIVGLWMRPDSRLASALPDRSPAYQSLAIADKELGGIELARLVVEWPVELAWDDAQVLAAVDKAQAIIEQEPTLSHPISIRNVIDSFPDEGLTPSQQMGRLDLLPTRLRDTFMQRESRRVLISFRAQDLGVGRYEHVFRRIEQELRDLERAYPGFRFELTGDVVVRGRTIYQIVEDLARSLGAASLIIFAMLTVSFRSLKLGLIALIPNLFPLSSTAFLLVVLDRPLNVSTVCAFTVCLGIAVDDTIHFMNRYTRLRREGMSADRAVKSGFLQVGAALIATTVILLVGFGTVITSELPSQRIFASMACCTIGAALFGDLVFLPALLSWFDQRDRSTSNRKLDQSTI